jgi:hypothetical protein
MISLKAETLYLNRLDNTTISTWNGYTCYAVGSIGLPLYRCNENMPYVSFGTSASNTSNGNYLNLGSQTFNEATSGITIIASVRFNSTKTHQRLVDFFISPGSGSIGIGLDSTTTNITYLYRLPGNITGYVYTSSTTLNTWNICVMRLVSNRFDSYTNSYASNSVSFPTTNNQTRPFCYIGRSEWTGDQYAHMDLREIKIWFNALSDNDIVSEISQMRIKYGILRIPYTVSTSIGSYLSYFSSSTNVSLTSQYQYLYSVVTSGLPIKMSDLIMCPRDTYAWYTASSFVSGVWKDLSGNNNHVTNIEGTLTSSTVANVSCLTGSTSTYITWPSNILPANFTLFHVSRYNGSNQQRIITGVVDNWLSGFWAAQVGVSYRNPYWITNSATSYNNTKWVISCDTNSMYRYNGVMQNITTNGSLTTNIGINRAGHELSDFAIAELIVYNSVLSVPEIARVEQYLSSKYNLPIASRTILGITSANILAIYSVRHLNLRYSGPIIRFQRSSDNAISDFYADIYGNLSQRYAGQGTSLSTWQGSSTLTVLTWYDQSGNSKNLTTTGASFVGGIQATTNGISGPNVFSSSSVTDMHVVISYAITQLVSVATARFSTSNANSPRFAMHLPWSANNIYYFDGGDISSQRCSGPGPTALNSRNVISAYKKTGAVNGFRVNQSTRFTSSGISTPASVDIFNFNVGDPNIYYDVVICDAQLSNTDEVIIETILMNKGSTIV